MIDKKILLISHIADPDGITPVILARLTYKNVDIKLLEIKDVEENVNKLINDKEYDEIHITDLSVSYELAKKINNSKFKIFDHHMSSIKLNEFDFAKIDIKESATSIYYKYIKTQNKKIEKNKYLSGLIEHVKAIDIYDFKKIKKENAEKIDILFSVFGREEYINHFTENIKRYKKFIFTKEEEYIIKLEIKKQKRYIDDKLKEVMKVKLNNNIVGLVYAESKRSQLGNAILEMYPELDYAIVINISRSISYRGKGKVDLNIISAKNGGGGHKNASGSPLPDNLLKQITKLIFKNIEFKEEE